MFRPNRTSVLIFGLAVAVLAAGCGRSMPLVDTDLVTLRLLPEDPTMYLEQEVQLTVEARYGDGSVVDVTTEPDLIFRLNQGEVVRLQEGNLLHAVHEGQVRLVVAWQGKQDSIDIEVRGATLDLIQVDPAVADLNSGDSLQLMVTGALSDGSRMDLSPAAAGTTYSSDRPAVVTPTTDGLVFAMTRGTAVITATHGDLSAFSLIQVDGGTPEPVRLDLLPPEVSIPVGEAIGLQLIGTYADGSSADLTADQETIFSTSDPDVATVEPGGVVLSANPGQTRITAVYRSLSSSSLVTVVPPSDLTGILVQPDQADLARGTNLQLVVLASYSDGSQLDVTAQADFTSSSPTVASVDTLGLVSANTAGEARVTAGYQGYSASSRILVTDRTLVDLWIEEDTISLAPGEGAQLTVMGRFSDGSVEDLSSAARGTVYDSSSAAVVEVGPDGRLTAIGPGDAFVTATNSGLVDRVDVSVSGAALIDLTVEPPSLDLLIGQAVQLLVTAHYSDGSSLDKTPEAVYSSDDTGVATVAATGLVQGEADGQTSISASFGGLQARVPVTVASPFPTRITVEPPSVTLATGENVQLIVTAEYSDGSQGDVTAIVGYQTSNPAVAGDQESTGLVDAQGPGQAVVTADLDGLTDTCQVTVPQIQVVDFWLEPAVLSMQPGGQAQLTAWARYSDGSLTRVTDQTGFGSLDPSVADVDAVGLVTANNGGVTSVIGTFLTWTATVQVTVESQPDLISLLIAPPSASLDVGDTLFLTVTAGYSDGSQADVTAQAGYSTSDPAMAQVQPGGRVDALGPGSVTITASFGGLTAESQLTITDLVVLVSIDLQPDSASLGIGTTLQLRVWANYSDGSSQEVTALSSYSSDDPTVVDVAIDGQATAAGAGTTSVRAFFGGQTDASTIQVNPPALIGISVVPPSASLDIADTLQLEVWANYADGSSSLVTSSASFTPADATVVSVSPGGLVTALGVGTTNVTASYGGFDADSLITVLPPTLEWIELLPESAVLSLTDTIQFTVIAHYSDGSQLDVTDPAFGTSYQSSDTGVLMIATDGFAWPVGAGGPVFVTATYAGLSDTATVTVVDNPQPTLSSIDPQRVLQGSLAGPMTAWGGGFTSNSVVRLDGGDLTTTFVAADQLVANLPAGFTTAVSIHPVSVFNPPPGGGTSNELELWVVGQPVITSVSPDSGLQGRAVRVGFYGSGLLGCSVVTDNPGITVSGITYEPGGLYLFATFSIDPTAPIGPASVTLSNLAGDATTTFSVLEDTGFPDCIVGAGQVVTMSGVQTCNDVLIETGAVVYGLGDEPLQLLATGDVLIRGQIHVSGSRGADGYYNPADGGPAGPGGGGGGGGGDGDLAGQPGSQGGGGTPPGTGGGFPSGAGTPSGDGGGTGAGSGISGGCGQAGGGAGFGGAGGGGGGDMGVGTGGAGGAANTQGSVHNGGAGGGGGSTCGPNSGGGGGGGGGVLVIATTGGGITIEGALNANGGAGGDGFFGTGGAGGGSGGRITVTAAGGSIVIEDTISVRGAEGGRSDAGDGGGGGGGGRILIDSGGGGVDDVLGYYELSGGAGGLSRDNGFDGQAGQPGVADILP